MEQSIANPRGEIGSQGCMEEYLQGKHKVASGQAACNPGSKRQFLYGLTIKLPLDLHRGSNNGQYAS